MKIIIFLPDGIGLRNFAYTDFYDYGKKMGFDIQYWNSTPFSLSDLGYKEIKFTNLRLHPLTDLYKRAKTQIELTQNVIRDQDEVYENYRFQLSRKGLKNYLKYLAVKAIIATHNSPKGLEKIGRKMAKLERTTQAYKECVELLKKEKPHFIFCTNQRIVQAIAPLLAAQDLNIPTATFIFSWDNVPKGTKVLDTDYYFVWSDHMKSELLHFYPNLREQQIKVTGTTQFESHFKKEFFQSRDLFFQSHKLESQKRYICFSGDDETTSPNDPQYLEDTATAVRNLNKKGIPVGIVFRRCPVDFSSRYDLVLENYSDVITVVNPKWKKIADGWNTVLPTKEDLILQTNTVLHTELVINLGSSMVFDYVCHEKPCCFINYDPKNPISTSQSVQKVYSFVHFRSMPSKQAVFWINSAEEIEQIIEDILQNGGKTQINEAQRWFEKINLHPADKCSERTWKTINSIIG